MLHSLGHIGKRASMSVVTVERAHRHNADVGAATKSNVGCERVFYDSLLKRLADVSPYASTPHYLTRQTLKAPRRL